MPGIVTRRSLLAVAGAGALSACATDGTGAVGATDSQSAARVLRTPDEAFANLADYRFQTHYVSIDDPRLGALRIHYVDEGPRTAPVIVMLHGQPSWSFLYRRQITALAARGYRVIAPDLVGYGRSDKPGSIDDHSYEGHVRWMTDFFAALDLDRPNLVLHDWGGLIGLPIVANNAARFGRLVVLNTSLPDGSDATTPEYDRAFDAWIRLLQTAPRIQPSRVIEAQTSVTLSPDILAGYDAPFPVNDLTSGPRALSALVPRRPGDAFAARNSEVRQRLRSWPNPVLIAFSADSARLHPGQHELFSGLFPTDRIWRDMTVEDTQHFLLEDAPQQLSALIGDFVAETSL
jgi:haloalkane dehalogenase